MCSRKCVSRECATLARSSRFLLETRSLSYDNRLRQACNTRGGREGQRPGKAMRSRVLENSPQETLPLGGNTASKPVAQPQQLMRRLIGKITNGVRPPTSRELENDAQEVLLDEEIDGARYLLVRSQPKIPYAQVLLSPREQEIARMVAKGHPNKVIAAVLDISPWTVSTHLRRIFAKLGVGSRAAMVARLLEDDLMREQPGSAELAALRHKRS
jgi:DNA-binding CsgD family transcriptional regulator